MIARLLSAALVLVIFSGSLLWSDLRNNPGHWPMFPVGERGIISSEFRIAIVSPRPVSAKGQFVELRALAAAVARIIRICGINCHWSHRNSERARSIASIFWRNMVVGLK